MSIQEVEMDRFLRVVTGCLGVCILCADICAAETRQSTDVADVSEDDAAETAPVFGPKTITQQWVLQTFKDAFMTATIDDDGDVAVQEQLTYWIRTYGDGVYLRIFTNIATNEDASEEAKMRYVNRVNNEMFVLRAALANPKTVVFDHYIVTIGGMSKHQLVATSRKFYELLSDAFARDTDNVLR